MMKTPDPIHLLIEVEDLIRSMPDRAGFGWGASDDHMSWLGRAEAIVTSWDRLQAVPFQSLIKAAESNYIPDVETAVPAIIRWLHRVRHDLKMRTDGPTSVALHQGSVFDYFDEVRKIIQQAKIDIMFVDPYLEAEFVSRYLPHVASGVTIRLMARDRMAQLLPAIELFRRQHGHEVMVRSVSGFHDRYIFIDGLTAYQSGASFADGARKTPTSLMQVTDAFPEIKRIYEGKWETGVSA